MSNCSEGGKVPPEPLDPRDNPKVMLTVEDLEKAALGPGGGGGKADSAAGEPGNGADGGGKDTFCRTAKFKSCVNDFGRSVAKIHIGTVLPGCKVHCFVHQKLTLHAGSPYIRSLLLSVSSAKD